jgi:hypothetical protein
MERNQTKTNKKTLCVRILSLLLCAVFLFSFAACGNGKSGDEDKNESTTQEAKDSFTISKDLEILAAYIQADDNERAFFTAKNNSDDTIIDFSIVCLGFDRNGNVAKISGSFDKLYNEEDYTLANILPSAVFCLPEENCHQTNSIYLGNESKTRYIKTAVSFIKFKSGKTWELGDKDAWAEKTIADFSLDTERKYVETLRADANAALTNPYIKLSNINSKHSTNQFIDANDLFFDVENSSDKNIASFSIIVAEFDGEGNGLHLSNAGYLYGLKYITLNSHKIPCDGLSAQQKTSFVCPSRIMPNCSSQLVIVDQIVFDDDTVWDNEYALQFMMFNEARNSTLS